MQTLNLHCNRCSRGFFVTHSFEDATVWFCVYCGHPVNPNHRFLISIEKLYELHKEGVYPNNLDPNNLDQWLEWAANDLQNTYYVEPKSIAAKILHDALIKLERARAIAEIAENGTENSHQSCIE
jgi:hypothetical protein